MGYIKRNNIKTFRGIEESTADVFGVENKKGVIQNWKRRDFEKKSYAEIKRILEAGKLWSMRKG